jgi:hypothetical protein
VYKTDSGLYVVGDQEPRILHLPGSALPELGSAGEAVEELCHDAGLDLDPWQAATIAESCTYREETFYNVVQQSIQHKWAAYEVGLMVSRQNGKGSILEARELAGLFLFGEKLIIHSAHQFDTSRKHFERIIGLIENSKFMMRQVAKVARSHGSEGIILKNGQELSFRTRTASGGRGFSCDCLVLDEAMILDSSMIRSLGPTLGARANAQIWYTGSAGTQTSTQFGLIRQRGIADDPDDNRLLYLEWSAELCDMFCVPGCTEHDDPYSVYTWAKANPSLNIVRPNGTVGLQMDALITNQRWKLADFASEHLGVGDWPTTGDGWRVIPKNKWEHQGVESSVLDTTRPLAMGIDVSPDESTSSIGAAGYSLDKTPTGQDIYHVELARSEDTFDHRPGTQWVVPRAKEIYDRIRISVIIIDPTTPAGVFVQPLRDLGCNVVTPNSREYAQSCVDFRRGIAPKPGDEPNIVNFNQEPLNDAAAAADKRKLTDLWAFANDNSTADISPIVAVDLALWGLKNHAHPVEDPWVMWD